MHICIIAYVFKRRKKVQVRSVSRLRSKSMGEHSRLTVEGLCRMQKNQHLSSCANLKLLTFHMCLFWQRFKCDKYSGWVTVSPCDTPGSGSCIDYERIKGYQLIVAAVDDNGEGLTATAAVNITIIDDNDNRPAFPTNPYTYYGNIVEGTSNPSPPLQVTVSD